MTMATTSFVQIIPCSLEDLQKADDMVFKRDSEGACAQCGAPKSEKPLQRCSRCRVANYCGQVGLIFACSFYLLTLLIGMSSEGTEDAQARM